MGLKHVIHVTMHPYLYTDMLKIPLYTEITVHPDTYAPIYRPINIYKYIQYIQVYLHPKKYQIHKHAEIFYRSEVFRFKIVLKLANVRKRFQNEVQIQKLPKCDAWQCTCFITKTPEEEMCSILRPICVMAG